MNLIDIDNWFTYHAPTGDQPFKYETIRERGKHLAQCIDRNVPDSREKSIAFRKLREAVMWANAGIACNDG